MKSDGKINIDNYIVATHGHDFWVMIESCFASFKEPKCLKNCLTGAIPTCLN